MGTKTSISPEVLKIINKTVNEAVKKAAEAIKKVNEEADGGQRNYFKETEKLLYSYPALKLKVAQDEEDLQNHQIVMKRRSADIIRLSGSGCNVSLRDPEADYIERRKASMERTKREVQRIDRALETIQDDQYYDIIPMKYFDNCTIEDIAERFNKDESTIKRNKNRLVNKLKIVLFGADAL